MPVKSRSDPVQLLPDRRAKIRLYEPRGLRAVANEGQPLTPREAEIWEKAKTGQRRAGIAKELGVKESTIKWNIRTIRRKLGIAKTT